MMIIAAIPLWLLAALSLLFGLCAISRVRSERDNERILIQLSLFVIGLAASSGFLILGAWVAA